MVRLFIEFIFLAIMPLVVVVLNLGFDGEGCPVLMRPWLLDYKDYGAYIFVEKWVEFIVLPDVGTFLCISLKLRWLLKSLIVKFWGD